MKTYRERVKSVLDFMDVDSPTCIDIAAEADAEIAELRIQLGNAKRIQRERVEDQKRYRWLRNQPDNTDAPRIDVVLWQFEDESANSGTGLRGEALDAAIDAALAQPKEQA